MGARPRSTFTRLLVAHAHTRDACGSAATAERHAKPDFLEAAPPRTQNQFRMSLHPPKHRRRATVEEDRTTHIVALLAAWNLQHDGSDGRFRARGGRRRKLFGRALRVCRPRLRHSAASATSRGSKSTTDRLAASGLRRSRGHAQPADQRLPIVDLKAEMGSVVDARTISGACCTFP